MDGFIGGILGGLAIFTLIAIFFMALRWVEKHYS